MRINISNDERSSFWLSYIGLITGLFFIFVLVVGVVVVRYSISASNLAYLQKDLNDNIASLNAANKELNKKHESIKSFIEQLKSNPDSNNIEQLYLNLNKELSKATSTINNSLDVISLKNDELTAHINKQEELISDLNNQINQRDIQIDAIENDLQNYKSSLENYTKIRENIALSLKSKLVNIAQIDPKTAEITMDAAKIFNINSSVIRDDAKFDLRRIFKVYLDYMLSSEVVQNINKIIIECHTDSDGGYMHNLDLSQKQALEIMKFAYAIYKNENLSRYLVAIGKSNSEPILKDGLEDPSASFRIKIKFDLQDPKYFIDKVLNQSAN
ncbi:MAG: OmpA family protein [Campylobacter sp.]|uniref:OmpA family protein n=1 Tax=Campylobacter sp. TaxID=205 RepID=UPI001B031B3B|nr:OmpA family protein [Campylobacter sp.]MBO7154600.1 OmpA family protein [Campylobacter sp.]